MEKILYTIFYGRTISTFIYIHDYVQLILDDNSILNLYNKIVVDGNSSDLINGTIKNFMLNDEKLHISIGDGVSVEMSMKAADYNGPEAFEYHKNNTIIIG